VTAETWLAALAIVALCQGAPGADLWVTDSRGRELLVTSGVVDYGGAFSVDAQSDGIRVLQGDGLTTVKWSAIDTLYVLRVEEGMDPPRATLEVVLRNHHRVSAELFHKGRMQLNGHTELGDYTIDLIKVRRIVPRR
jgi:hypothetical protein